MSLDALQELRREYQRATSKPNSKEIFNSIAHVKAKEEVRLALLATSILKKWWYSMSNEYRLERAKWWTQTVDSTESIIRNLAEGLGKGGNSTQVFYSIARGSLMESVAETWINPDVPEEYVKSLTHCLEAIDKTYIELFN